jgi:hypothetical protein
MRNWDFLLKDTSLTTRVTGVTATAASASVSAPTSGTFDFINPGQGVTVSGSATLAAGTTVSSITRSTDGTIASIVLSNVFGGTTNTAATLTFSANIHITIGTNDYSLPLDLSEPYSARFITDSKRPLAYKRIRTWDRTQWDQTTQGSPTEYTMYNPYSDGTQNFGTSHLKFDVVPSITDDLFLRYYRIFIVDGTYVDVPDEYLYHFLDHCRGRALEAKRAQENPTKYLDSVLGQTETTANSEEEKEDDTDNYMKSQMEQSGYRDPVIGNDGYWS